MGIASRNCSPTGAKNDSIDPVYDDCALCEVLAGSPVVPFWQLFSRLECASERILETDRLAVISDIAPLGPGHVLILPFEHISAISLMSPNDCAEIEKLRLAVDDILYPWTERPSIAFEHGLCGRSGTTGGCGINHAHLHVMPYPGNVRSALTGTYDCSEITSLGDLTHVVDCNTEEYLLLIDQEGRHTFADVQSPTRQFFRRTISELQFNDLWNWSDQVLLGDASKRRLLIEETRRMFGVNNELASEQAVTCRLHR